MGMSREEAIKVIRKMLACTDLTVRANLNADMVSACNLAIKALEQESQTFKWCDTCKEYDQEKHCCHRYSKVIRDTVEEMKQEQEHVLDKIRDEIIAKDKHVKSIRSDGRCFFIAEEVLDILDKYKAETENT